MDSGKEYDHGQGIPPIVYFHHNLVLSQSRIHFFCSFRHTLLVCMGESKCVRSIAFLRDVLQMDINGLN